MPSHITRRDQDAVGQLGFGAANDLTDQHAIGEHRQVVAMLFQGSQRDHDWRVLVERRDRGPAHLGKLHFDTSNARGRLFLGDAIQVLAAAQEHLAANDGRRGVKAVVELVGGQNLDVVRPRLITTVFPSRLVK